MGRRLEEVNRWGGKVGGRLTGEEKRCIPLLFHWQVLTALFPSFVAFLRDE